MMIEPSADQIKGRLWFKPFVFITGVLFHSSLFTAVIYERANDRLLCTIVVNNLTSKINSKKGGKVLIWSVIWEKWGSVDKRVQHSAPAYVFSTSRVCAVMMSVTLLVDRQCLERACISLPCRAFMLRLRWVIFLCRWEKRENRIRLVRDKASIWAVPSKHLYHIVRFVIILSDQKIF